MAIIGFKINGVIKDTEYNRLPLGRKMEHNAALKAFKDSAKSTHISQKRKSHKQAIREFIKLYNVTEYYYVANVDTHCYDDTFEIWYK